MSAAPYAEAAPTYQRGGWSPVPLPAGQKFPPPTGWTGYAAPHVSGADVYEWASHGHTADNVGLRMPETVLGLDLDAYDGKPGLATMLAATDRLGALPPSPRSTSRPDDPVSGIRFYRVPAGRRWADVLGPGVEIIHYGHRYAVAAPSRHPEGRAYAWYGPDGSPMPETPVVNGLPELPPEWVADLDRGDVSTRSTKADLMGADVTAWLVALPTGHPCRYVTRLLTEAQDTLGPAASRHDTVRGFIAKMLRAGDQGHEGAGTGLHTLESLWRAALARGKAREADPGEWHRMVTGGVAIIVKDPTSVFDKGCCPADPPTPSALTADAAAQSDDRTGVELEAQLDAAALFAREVTVEAYKLRVREQAREKVASEKASAVVLPALHQLGDFLAVPDEPVTHRVTDLWPSGGRVVLSAQHKAGKTTLAGNLLRSLVDGQPFLDAFPVAVSGRVLLIDNELDERMLRRWLRDQGITNTTAVDLIPLRGRLSTFDILDPTTRTRWAEHLCAADVLIFDCLRPALDALGLSEDKDAGRFLEALDELTTEAGIGETLVVHHMGHSGERSRGDSRILDWPDAVWKLIKDAEDEAITNPRRYFAAYGRDVDHPETLLGYDPVARRLSVAGGSRRDRKVDEALDAVLQAVEAAGEALSGRQVEERLRDTGPGRDTIRAALKRGIETGHLVIHDGPRNSTMHLLNPSSARVREQCADQETARSNECASAPIEGARSLTHSSAVSEQQKPAHSITPRAVVDLDVVLGATCPRCNYRGSHADNCTELEAS